MDKQKLDRQAKAAFVDSPRDHLTLLNMHLTLALNVFMKRVRRQDRPNAGSGEAYAVVHKARNASGATPPVHEPLPHHNY